MTCNPKLNAIGFVFELSILDCETNLPVPLNNAASKKIHFKKPDGTVITRNGAFKTDGADAVITYTTIAGDLDSVGLWHVQYAVDLPIFSSGTNTVTFQVEANMF